MKKILLTFLSVLIVQTVQAADFQAPQIVGQWSCQPLQKEVDSTKETMVTYRADGTTHETTHLHMILENHEFHYHYVLSGKWHIKNNVLVERTKLEKLEVQHNTETQTALANNTDLHAMEEMIRELLRASLNYQDEEYEGIAIQALTNNEMVLADNVSIKCVRQS